MHSSISVITSRNVYNVGNRIEITCFIESEKVNLSDIVVKQVYTTAKGTYIENVFITTLRSNNSVSIIIPSASVNNGGTYGCYEATSNSSTKDLTPLSKQTICVLDVEKPLNFTCVLRDFKSVQCSWESNKTTYWQLQYKCVSCENQSFNTCNAVSSNAINSNMGDIFSSCSQALTSKRCNGSVYTSCTLLVGKDVYSDNNYLFRVIGCNAFSTDFWEYNVSIGDHIVKLRRVTNMTAVPLTNSMWLSWVLPFSPNVVWNGMVCLVAYSLSENLNNMKSYFLYLNNTISSKLINYQLDGLTSYTNYTFFVSCRPRDSIYWSENTTVEKQTSPGVPLNGPYFVEGGYAYYDCTFSNAKCLALYWQNPDWYVIQGEVKGYVIFVSNGKETNVSRYITGKRISAYLDIKIDINTQYKIFGRIANNQGYSKSQTHLVIPARNKATDPEGVCVKYTYDDKQQMYNVSYQTQSEHQADSRVTFFWCQGVANKSNVVMCQSDLHSEYSNDSSIQIKPVASTLLHFAVEINRNNYSTGMIWKKCLETTVLKETKQTGIPFETVLGSVLGSVLALVVLSVILSCSKKMYDKFRSYNPVIDVPVIHEETQKMQYSSTNNNKSPIIIDVRGNKAEFISRPLEHGNNTVLSSISTNVDSNYGSDGGIYSKNSYTSPSYRDYLKFDTGSNFESITIQTLSGTTFNTDITSSYCDGQKIFGVETTYNTVVCKNESNEINKQRQDVACCSSSEYRDKVDDYNKFTYSSDDTVNTSIYQSVT